MRICFAGAEKERSMDELLSVGAENLLCSYFYFRKMSDSKATTILEKAKEAGAFVMLDSGAHTYFSFHGKSLFHRKHIAGSSVAKEKPKGYVEPEVYILEYISWLKKFGHYFDVYVELDIDSIVGVEKIEEWRALMEEEGLTPMPVYHTSYEGYYGYDSPMEQLTTRKREWTKLVEKYEYIGIQGGMEKSEYIEMLQISDKAGRKVHGFAMTNKDVFRNLTFYSVDSTSWMMGAQYGVTYVFSGDELKTKDPDHKSVRANYEDWCEKHSIDYAALMDDSSGAVNQFNASMWVEYQNLVITPMHRNDASVIAAGERKEIKAVQRPEVRGKDQTAEFGYHCNTCYIADKCPFYKKDSTCSIPFKKAALKAQGEHAGKFSIEKALNAVVEQTYERLQFALVAEKAKGGLVNPDISKEIDRFVHVCQKVREILNPQDSIEIKAKGNGIISQLFGGYGKGGGTKPSETGKDHRYDADEYENFDDQKKREALEDSDVEDGVIEMDDEPEKVLAERPWYDRGN